MDEQYWAAYRKRARRRANAQMSLVVGPLVILTTVLWFFSLMDHPAGDLRDNIVFRLVSCGLMIGFVLTGLVVSVRWLLADRDRSSPRLELQAIRRTDAGRSDPGLRR